MSELISQSNARSNDDLRYILKSLDTLTENVKELQASLTTLQISLATRSDLKELRDHCDAELQKQRDRWELERRELDKAITAIQVKTAGIAALVGAGMSLVLKKLAG